MQTNSLLNVQTPPAKKSEPAYKSESESASKSSKFDQHLNKQIDQNKPAETRLDKENVHENQQYSDNEEVVDSEVVAEEPVSTEEAGVTENIILVDEQHLEIENILSVDIEESLPEDQIVAMPINEQSLPQTGNTLPLDQSLKQTKNTASINTVNDKALANQQTAKQPSLAEALLADDGKEDFLSKEFKPLLKNDQLSTSQVLQAKAGFSVAALVNNATVQQQVPLSTALASINMQSATATESLTNATVTSAISAPVQSSVWSQGVSERVVWMVQSNFQTAELKLNPANLGPLEIKLSVQDDKASVTFITAHAPVKEAIDLAMPRLREMLEQQGLNLVDVDVSQYSDARDEQAEASSGQGASVDNGLSDGEELMKHESMLHVNVDNGLSVFV